MMYRLISEAIVQRLSDGAFIPLSEENTDCLVYLDWVRLGNIPEPAEQIEPQTPSVVSAARGGMALIRMGKMQSVMAVVNAADTPAEVKWAFDKATEWNRYSDAFQYISAKAGISESEQKELFDLAATLTP